MILNPTLTRLDEGENSLKTSLIDIVKYILWSYRLNFKLFPGLVFAKNIVTVFTSVERVIYAFYWATFIDAVISKNISQITEKTLWFLLFTFISLVIGSVWSRFDNAFQSLSKFEYSNYFVRKIRNLGIRRLEDPNIANLVYRVNDSYGSLWDSTNKIAITLAKFVTAVVSSVIVFQVSWQISLIIIVVTLIRMFFYSSELKRDWQFGILHTENKRISSRHFGVISNVETLKEIIMTDSFRFFIDKYKNFHTWYYDTLLKMRYKRSAIAVVFEILLLVAFSGLIYITLQSYLSGDITIGELTFYIIASQSFISNLKEFMGMVVAVGEGGERLKDPMKLEAMNIADDDTVELVKMERDHRPLIEFKNVSFAYPNGKKTVIRNLNLTIEPGEKVAIVGENGAGKSTLMNILLGFYPVTKGEILLDGVDINKISMDSWYKNIGMLLQSFNTYGHISLASNISLNGVEDKRIKSALKLADADTFVQGYEFGLKQILDPKFTNGVSPSGGQWQKIAIARFLYRNPPVIILDEPTSALDSISESKIFSNLFEELKSKTVVIISHRFSTVKKADRIVVMKEGRIVEEGSHRKLMELNGVYANAYNTQANSYRD
ncbi:ABC transporter ATP-binding protein [Candidatus Dojkabacteria bacterium]|nr:ABC transporter ATP-binding protein [Candidatus Dojkabacteria bacterium]